MLANLDRFFHASGKTETLNCKIYDNLFALFLKYLEVVRHSDSSLRVFATVSVVVVSISNHSSIPTVSFNQSKLVALKHATKITGFFDPRSQRRSVLECLLCHSAHAYPSVKATQVGNSLSAALRQRNFEEMRMWLFKKYPTISISLAQSSVHRPIPPRWMITDT